MLPGKLTYTHLIFHAWEGWGGGGACVWRCIQPAAGASRGEQPHHNLHWSTMVGAPEYTGSMMENCLQAGLKVSPQWVMSLDVKYVGEIPLFWCRLHKNLIFIKKKSNCSQRRDTRLHYAASGSSQIKS